MAEIFSKYRKTFLILRLPYSLLGVKRYTQNPRLSLPLIQKKTQIKLETLVDEDGLDRNKNLYDAAIAKLNIKDSWLENNSQNAI